MRYMPTLREFVFVPALGRPIGEVLEAPFMLGAIIASAQFAILRCKVSPEIQARLLMGVASLALVLVTELILSPLVRGSVQAWLDSFGPVTLVLSTALWAAHALMPVIVAR